MKSVSKIFTRRRFLQAVGGATLAGIGTYGYATTIAPHRLKVEHVWVGILGLAPGWEGKRIVVLSDLHAGPRVSMKYLERALQMSADLRPEALCIVGDIVDDLKLSHLPELCDVLSSVAEEVPIYGVLGNHDFGPGWGKYAPGYADTVSTALRQAGVQVLRNEFRMMGGGGAGAGELCFVGLDDAWSPSMDPKILERTPKDAVVILLSHNPDTYELVEKYRWDLMLSGHTHGGQVRVPGYGPLILPVRHRERSAGLFHLDATQPHRALYVTRGVGHLRKIRFFCPPEITCITLEQAMSGVKDDSEVQ